MVKARLTRHMEDDAHTMRFRRCNLTNFPIAKDAQSWHVRSSSYERTPKIGGFRKQIAKRATSADNSTEFLQGVAPVALTDLRRSFRTIENFAGWRRSWFLRL